VEGSSEELEVALKSLCTIFDKVKASGLHVTFTLGADYQQKAIIQAIKFSREM
jgi:hypothetical protein